MVYDDVYLGRYYEYLDQGEPDLPEIGIDDLRRHGLMLTDEHGNSRNRYSVFKSLVFDTTLPGAQGETFHLCEGNWYRVDDNYIARLSAYLDPLCADSDLPPYDHPSEGEYNKAAARADPGIACLDTQRISPDGQSAVEPCDLLAVRDGVATFYHVKVSTLSAHLSHLFNQGVNAIELLRLEPQAVDKLEALIRGALGNAGAEALVTLIRNLKYRVVFGIVTRKDPGGRSQNLPLFSRISLMRGIKALKLMDVQGRVIFIANQSAAAAGGRKKKRRKRQAAANAQQLTAEATEQHVLRGPPGV